MSELIHETPDTITLRRSDGKVVVAFDPEVLAHATISPGDAMGPFKEGRAESNETGVAAHEDWSSSTAAPSSPRIRLLCVMPTMRWRNWPRIVECFRAAAEREPRVLLEWMPVLTDAERRALPHWATHYLHSSAKEHAPILVSAVPMIGDRPEQLVVTKKNNYALELITGSASTLPFPPSNAYFWFGSDDNLVPRCFCQKFYEGASTGKKIVVGGHKRGSGPGKSGHGISDLVPQAASMRIGSVSGEQCFIHASVMRDRRMAAGGCPDGQLMADLIKEMPQEFAFVQNFWIPFNALEEGRWKPGEVEKWLAL